VSHETLAGDSERDLAVPDLGRSGEGQLNDLDSCELQRGRGITLVNESLRRVT
jgi:hypothetical protein